MVSTRRKQEHNKKAKHAFFFLRYFTSFLSISLIEPGPVITEFERKVYDEGLKTDLSKADKVTAEMFRDIYLKNYKQIFETLGQTAEDIAEVRRLFVHKRCPPHYVLLRHAALLCDRGSRLCCALPPSILSRSSPWRTPLSATRRTRFTPP